eukprot:comp24278_c0_seq1/m.45321 comp24278_c0_seq1/g.45321  ORF comp24278_c0_seq1/g.45321 comp24278_c0_seq1/m.45321 type:complete len:318 (+) comp24278_c0_seq1:40-993(+)
MAPPNILVYFRAKIMGAVPVTPRPLPEHLRLAPVLLAVVHALPICPLLLCLLLLLLHEGLLLAVAQAPIVAKLAGPLPAAAVDPAGAGRCRPRAGPVAALAVVRLCVHVLAGCRGQRLCCCGLLRGAAAVCRLVATRCGRLCVVLLAVSIWGLVGLLPVAVGIGGHGLEGGGVCRHVRVVAVGVAVGERLHELLLVACWRRRRTGRCLRALRGRLCRDLSQWLRFVSRLCSSCGAILLGPVAVSCCCWLAVGPRGVVVAGVGLLVVPLHVGGLGAVGLAVAGKRILLVAHVALCGILGGHVAHVLGQVATLVPSKLL